MAVSQGKEENYHYQQGLHHIAQKYSEGKRGKKATGRKEMGNLCPTDTSLSVTHGLRDLIQIQKCQLVPTTCVLII